MKCLALWAAIALAILAPVRLAHASGLYLFDRGARALSRGGAFVAGADDPNALWYNPAGLAASKNQVLGDGTLTLMFASFRRLDDGGQFAPSVSPQIAGLPIPTLGVSHDLGTRDFTFGFGVFAPNVVLLDWPRSVDSPTGRAAAPQRYSLISMKGSALANLGAGLAYHGIEGLSLGADLQVIAGRFKAETVLSACDGAVCTFPEDPEFDARTTLDALPTWGVTAALGATYDVEEWRFGVSATLPYELRGNAKLDIDLPSSPVFGSAKLDGDRATVSMKFPTIVRAGAEMRAGPNLRLEASFVWEQWSRQKAIRIDAHDITIRNVRGIGDYDVGSVSLARNMRDTWSLRGGYELTIPEDWLEKVHVVLRGGLGYERGAFSNQSLTPLTLDGDKWLLSGGLGIGLTESVRLDTMAAYVFMADPKVRNSRIVQPGSIRPALADATHLGNGNYRMDALMLGGALVWKLD